MALKKSEIYSSLWASCDELRGGMDASQYKDYVLSLLFIKYISDKYAGMSARRSPIKIPEGACFSDMVALKGTKDIGDKINTKIIEPLAKANQMLSQSDFPDFNDEKLGDGDEKAERLTNLVAIFERKALDFSKNRADGDDILGDAYEYLMRNFATESGKSKGQFYTPAEVSRIMAQIIGIHDANTSGETTVYDPTCGSGSLLLKVGDQAPTHVTLYGQEKDVATSGLARMNMILHNYPTAEIVQGNTLSDPKFKPKGQLATFDYVVANPPFSDKRWSTGVDPENDEWNRFQFFGTPPGKQGDYAYLLHIVRSLKSTGTGACILPHGVLFRGNAEAVIRKKLLRSGYIKGIIGLPANLFYGTGIPACIVVVDKRDASARKGIFMVDASKGFMKDGPKNRLRSQDLHRIVDTFNSGVAKPGYSRHVSFDEIERNEFNLNLPRYIESQETEDTQDIAGHLFGGIPIADIDALKEFWDVCPTLRKSLFHENREGYRDLAVEMSTVKTTIFQHPEFTTYISGMNDHFAKWRKKTAKQLRSLEAGHKPKELIIDISEALLAHYRGKPLIDPYAVYQHVMDYWSDTMQDDCYSVSADGWKAEAERVIEKDKNGKSKDKGWVCDLIPKPYIVARYFQKEQAAIEALETERENLEAAVTELEEEHSGEDGPLSGVSNKTDAKVAWQEAFDEVWQDRFSGDHTKYTSALGTEKAERNRMLEMFSDPRIESLKDGKGKLKITAVRKAAKDTDNADDKLFYAQYDASDKAAKDAKKQAKELAESAETTIRELVASNPDDESLSDLRVLTKYLRLGDEITAIKSKIKEAEAELDKLAYEKYPELTEDEIKTLVVDDKWMTTLDEKVHGEMDRISQSLASRVKDLAERYETPMPQLVERASQLETRVGRHLERMGFPV